ncbi:unnamed protein product [Lathyrus oleraceus]
MAFSIHRSFFYFILCIALIFPSGFVTGENEGYRCIRYCDDESNCSKYCGFDGYQKGGKCMTLTPGMQYWCCCYT